MISDMWPQAYTIWTSFLSVEHKFFTWVKHIFFLTPYKSRFPFVSNRINNQLFLILLKHSYPAGSPLRAKENEVQL